MSSTRWGVPRVVIGSALGAILATVVLWFVFTYHPFKLIPPDWRDFIGSVWTGLLTILGGMIEKWRMDKKVQKAREQKDDSVG